MVTILPNFEQYSNFKTTHSRVIVLYGAEWCKACTGIKPLYEQLAKKHRSVHLGFVDIDKCQLKFAQVPVFVALYHGKEIDSMVGADDDALIEFVNKLRHYKSREPKREDVRDRKKETRSHARPHSTSKSSSRSTPHSTSKSSSQSHRSKHTSEKRESSKHK